MTCAERHLCRTFDCVLPCGAPDPKFIRRGNELKLKMRPVMPPQVGELGAADPLMLGMSLVHLRFCELAAMIHKFC